MSPNSPFPLPPLSEDKLKLGATDDVDVVGRYELPVTWEKTPLRRGSTKLELEPGVGLRTHPAFEGGCEDVVVIELGAPSALDAGESADGFDPLLVDGGKKVLELLKLSIPAKLVAVNEGKPELVVDPNIFGDTLDLPKPVGSTSTVTWSAPGGIATPRSRRYTSTSSQSKKSPLNPGTPIRIALSMALSWTLAMSGVKGPVENPVEFWGLRTSAAP